jgi:GNAT superfamily N-acetyltransferase
MVTIHEFEGPLDTSIRSPVFDLYRRIFGDEPGAAEEDRLDYAPGLHLLLARNEEGQAVGFKLGYRDRPGRFYSWLGGLLPEYRGQGLARILMDRQHAYCRDQGYRFIRTQTRNRWRNMLILNLKAGFDVIGTQTNRKGEVIIMLEKKL